MIESITVSGVVYKRCYNDGERLLAYLQFTTAGKTSCTAADV